MAICHDARKGRHSGSHWSKPARLRSTRPIGYAMKKEGENWQKRIKAVN
jgi:hypothetical protein